MWANTGKAQSCENYHCYVISENGFSDDLGKYDTYGVTASGGSGAVTLHDVSANRETAVEMADLFTRCRVSFHHLMDVLEDILP